MASNDFDFEYLPPHNELKGKSISSPFFMPKDPAEKLERASLKVLKYDEYLMSHTNPMVLQRTTDYAHRTRVVGFDETKEKLTADITNYYYP